MLGLYNILDGYCTYLHTSLVVHSVAIPPDSDGSGTKVTGRHGMVLEQAADCAIILS